MSVSISVIIVTWNSERWITACLKSLLSQTWSNFEIIVVDNYSQDKTISLLQQYSIHLKQMDQNVGFCEAVNQGYRISNGEFLFILNPDVRLDAHCLERLVQTLEKLDDNIGMLAPKLMDYQGNSIDSLGLKLSFLRRFYNHRQGEVDRGDSIESREIWGPCGAAALYSRKMLERINPQGEIFDPLFFAYGEDFDLAWRGQRAGFKALLVSSSVGYHVRGGSFIEKEKKQYLSWRNRYFLLLKNESLMSFLVRLPLMVFYDLPRFIHFILTNSYCWVAMRDLLTYASCHFSAHGELVVRRSTGSR